MPARSNNFENNQNVFLAYNTYQFAVNKWGFKAGMRLEQTVIDAGVNSTASETRQNYLNVIPALVISRKLKDMSSVNISFISRMQRPGISQLNPFVDRSNPEFETSGNPDLKPTITHIIQAGYNRSKKTNISLVAAYMFFNNLIGPVSSYDLGSKITHTTFENLSKGRVLRSNVYINYPVNNKLNVTFNTDIRYAWLTTIVNDKGVDNNGLMAYLNISTGYRFEKEWRVNANLTMNSSNVSGPQTKINGYTNISFSLNKEIVKDKLTFTALITNPFTEYRSNRKEKFGPNFSQINDNKVFYRGFGAALNYRFGKLKGEIKKNRRSIINDDLVNTE